jgi:glycosyltransferase involved in cell wall biosynthesis
MRVLVVTSMYLSGHGNWVAEQVRSLRDIGLEVDVVFFNPKRARFHYVLSIPKIARALRSRHYDIIHTHHTYTMIDVILARGLAGSRTPVVLTTHEVEALDQRSRTWHPSSYLRHSVAVKRFAARNADFVIFVARQQQEVMDVRRPSDVIPCGVDLQKFRPMDREVCRQELGLAPDGAVVFFPADPRNPRKRFELARRAFEIARGQLPRAVLLTGGGIDADRMPVYFNAADVVVQTSFGEASPTVVKEALACEVPIVSTDAGDTREVVNGLTGCAVCPEDAEAVAAQILACWGRRPTGGRDHLRRKGLALDQVARRVAAAYIAALGA